VALLAPCPYPHCRRLTTGGACRLHRRARDRARGTARARGYDADWQALSRDWLRRFPWCGQRADGRLYAEHSRCVRRGRRTLAAVTDHIVSLRDGGARLDRGNLQSLCVSCNTRKG
jgi:5-methylcytosine-specific restriction endonuclease McrA